MKYNKILLSLFLGIFLFSLVSASTNFTDVQKTNVCNVLNLSLSNCFMLWSGVDQYYVNGSFLPVQNNTIYVNVTNSSCNSQNSSENSSFIASLSCSQQLEFVKQDQATKIRLAEIEKGISSCNVSSLPVDSISKSDCELQKSEQFQKGRDSNVVSVSSSKSDSSYLIWIIFAVVILAGLYFYFNKNKVVPYQQYPQKFVPISEKERVIDDGKEA